MGASEKSIGELNSHTNFPSDFTAGRGGMGQATIDTVSEQSARARRDGEESPRSRLAQISILIKIAH